LLATLRMSWRDGRWREDEAFKIEYVLLAASQGEEVAGPPQLPPFSESSSALAPH
jgi:hypothetical protein